jgi:hypothetical protein
MENFDKGSGSRQFTKSREIPNKETLLTIPVPQLSDMGSISSLCNVYRWLNATVMYRMMDII